MHPSDTQSRTSLFPRRSLRRIAEADHGGALVELALTLPVLFAVLLGSAEFGRLAYVAIEVNNAARAGVAYGAQNTTTAANTAGIQTAATNDGADISGVKPIGLAATATLSCTCSDGKTTITCANTTACISPYHVEEFLNVTTTATMDPTIHVPGLPTTYAMTGTATMQVIQ
jgi:Flp pilus assembly protein TadG